MRSTPNPGRPPTPRADGFTLIEMLVVLLVMGMLVGLVGVSARPDERALLRVEADRLAQLMNLANTEAQLTGRSIAWTADASGYRFWRHGEGSDWSLIENDLLRPRRLPGGIRISALRIEQAGPSESMRMEFRARGTELSFSLLMTLGNARATLDRSPIGEVRVLTLLAEGSDANAQVKKIDVTPAR